MASSLLFMSIAVADGCFRTAQVTMPMVPAIPACKRCPAIEVVKAGAGGNKAIKDFAVDNPDDSGQCSKRTFVCMGTNAAIGINNGDSGQIQDGVGDDILDGMVTLVVTCKADGTNWESMGVAIKKLECTAVPTVPACKRCPDIEIVKAGAGGNPIYRDFEPGMIDNSGECSKRTYVCKGPGAAIGVQVDREKFEIQDGDPIDIVIDGMVSLVVTCHADGTDWEFMFDGMAFSVMKLECSAGI